MRGPPRSAAVSDNELDITNSLFGGLDEGKPGQEENIFADLGLGGQDGIGATGDGRGDGSDDDDAIYIAAQQAASNKKATVLPGKGMKRSGGFQSMGLNSHVLKAVSRKGFTVPTPIQRKTIPLILDGQDVVGMARTGSGKTAAFVIPMLEKLKRHSAKVGARGIILSPSRELALQTLKVVKELGKGSDLRTILLVGGDSLEDQFSSMASNPDVIIATPGRFEHLKVEMRLDLSSVRYVVFDEADRLFEMGFAAQLADIIHDLPPSRQTLLFSATLPKSLVEFARAGLQDPKLVRLDAESKISPDLENAFFTVNSSEKEGALLHILRDVVKMPTGETEVVLKAKEQSSNHSKKRKRGADALNATESPTEHSTIVFAATKHHVEYLASFLTTVGYAVSYVYGALDQTARKMQVQNFRSGMTNILVVTDVAARGVDIPILANVINYDFPPQPKVFVHRVGRTARAGRKGWSYSLLTTQDLPYLLDLQLFLGRKMIVGRESEGAPNYAECIVLGSLVRDRMAAMTEETGKILNDDFDLAAMRATAAKGEQQYLRTRNSASAESVKRAKAISTSPHLKDTHLLFESTIQPDIERAREDMLARVSGFRPAETVFEIGRRGTSSQASEIMKRRRSKIQTNRNQEPKKDEESSSNELLDETDMVDGPGEDTALPTSTDLNLEEASEDELEVTFSQPEQKKTSQSWQDSEHFMPYLPQTINVAEDRGYGVHSGSYNDSRGNFLQAARGATMDLAGDENKGFSEASKPRGLRWDKKSKKYVARSNDEDGSKGKKMIRGENGLKIAATMSSGRFDAWRKANRVDVLPRVGESEKPTSYNRLPGKRFKHKGEKTAKAPDKFRDDYYKKKKRAEETKEKQGSSKPTKGKSELRGVDDVHKQRSLQQKRKDKNARPTKKRA